MSLEDSIVEYKSFVCYTDFRGAAYGRGTALHARRSQIDVGAARKVGPSNGPSA